MLLLDVLYKKINEMNIGICYFDCDIKIDKVIHSYLIID